MPKGRARGGSGNGSGEQVELLRAIWNEMKGLKASLESQLETTRRELGGRIDQTNNRLDAARTELKEELGGLGRRMVESEVRLATVTTQLSGDVQELSGLIRDWRDEHRADRAAMGTRVTRLEEHVGLTPKP